MGEILLLALLAALNPTLLAAVTLMLLLPSPSRLMLGYLLGAYVTAISVGLVIVLTLGEGGLSEAGERTVSPAQDFVLGGLALLIAFVLGTDRDKPLRERRQRRRDAKQSGSEEPKQALPMRLLGRGSPRIAFVVGLVLSFPGGSYLAGLLRIDRLDASTAATVALVVGFVLIEMALLEVPLLGYAFNPSGTQQRVDSITAWFARNGRRALIAAAGIIGALLIVRGVLELVF
jgi:hypothetical protein